MHLIAYTLAETSDQTYRLITILLDPPTTLSPKPNYIGRTFGRIKSSHAPTHRLRDHTLQGCRACIFGQGNAGLPVSNSAMSRAEVSLWLEAWIGCGS